MRAWQSNRELTAMAASVAVGGYRAAMGLNEVLYKCQSDAKTFAIEARGVSVLNKHFEYVRQRLGRDTNLGVQYLYNN